MATGVQRLSRRQIDTDRWDAAVASDPRPRPYALSWWLDAAATAGWEGLVLDDYRAVLPLPFLRRFGVMSWLQRPPFTQQLGPYGDVRAGDLAILLSRVPRTRRFSLPLAVGAIGAEIPDTFTIRRRSNLVLDLSAGYAAVEINFSKNMRAHVRRAGSQVLGATTAAAVVGLCRTALRDKADFTQQQLHVLKRLIAGCEARTFGGCYRLSDEDGLLCAGFFPRWGGRTYNLCCASTPRGLATNAMEVLLARIMERDAAPGHRFDFEGSELPGVRRFFMKFRPAEEWYLQLG